MDLRSTLADSTSRARFETLRCIFHNMQTKRFTPFTTSTARENLLKIIVFGDRVIFYYIGNDHLHRNIIKGLDFYRRRPAPEIVRVRTMLSTKGCE